MSEDVDDDLGPCRCDMCGDSLDESPYAYWTENGEVCQRCYDGMDVMEEEVEKDD